VATTSFSAATRRASSSFSRPAASASACRWPACHAVIAMSRQDQNFACDESLRGSSPCRSAGAAAAAPSIQPSSTAFALSLPVCVSMQQRIATLRWRRLGGQ